MDTVKDGVLLGKELTLEFETIQAVIESRKRQNGLAYYIPNKHQLKAHQSDARMVLVCGANRIGKSTLGAVELAMHLTRKYPDWWSKKRRFYRPIKAVVVCDAMQKIEKVIEPKIMEFIPQSYVREVSRITGSYLNRLETKDGSTVDFLTSEQDQMRFEGADWDFYWGDEPQRKKQFDGIMRGLVDRRGITVLTFTPLVEPWMKEDLVDKADGVKIDVITAVMHDNQFDIKGNPILLKSDIDEYEQSLSEDMRDTRIYGKFFHLRGMVYTEFSEVHKIEFGYQYPDPVIAVLDPHDRQPHHVIWAIVDRNDDLFIHSELSTHCTVQELSNLIKKVEKDNGYRMRRRLIDPNFGRSPLITTGRTFIQELAKSGCGGWTESDDAKDEGRLKVKEYLHYNNKQPISFTNKPKLFFHKFRTPLTIHSIQNHQYEEWIGKIASERDPKERSRDKETHGADCFDDKTQVLTGFGWRFFKDIKVGDLLMTKNGQYEPCSEVISYHYSGEMIKVDSQHLDIVCTPNHKLLVDRGRTGKLDYCLASNLKPTHRIPRIPNVYNSMLNGFVSIKPTWTNHGNHWEKEYHIQSEVWAEFIGWYISEGSCAGTKGGKIQVPGRGYQVIISQSDVNSENVEMIRTLLSKMPWKFTRFGNNFICSSKQLWEILKPLGNSHQKRIPREVLNLSTECLSKLWNSMIRGDGWIRKSEGNRFGREHYASVSFGLADDTQELLLKLGKPSSIHVRKSKPYCIRSRYGNNTQDQNIINPHSQLFGVLRDSTGKSKISKINYNGNVYCATVPSHTLVIRRNFKTAVVGNCIRYLCMSNPAYEKMETRIYELETAPY